MKDISKVIRRKKVHKKLKRIGADQGSPLCKYEMCFSVNMIPSKFSSVGLYVAGLSNSQTAHTFSLSSSLFLLNIW